ncbi:RICIN domain-containing protein [Streptacidiphilus fuscans]|uniref:Ricin-type beta-trefoil lectin domain protein n=1 Tax=Streptacidiphilus fuscans TaxID=2789292 RepID=A0A931FF86_9ACTN|nr:RICIN domain-containing protein [Streptacidiphilus fuscans]MBF9069546.1 ricin-type beta-trefoil lectin domain protein [Streptacidiphilus fuscans]
MTVSSRSAQRVPARGAWVARLFPWRGNTSRPGTAARPDHGLWTVDRVVRALTAACDDANREIPAVHTLVVGADTVRLHLSTPDEQPPAGWSCQQEGRVWQAALREIQLARVSEALTDPFPRLVSLGSSRQGFVLLNLARAGGIIALEGDSRQARTLADDWIRELTTNPWAQDVQVVRVGFRTPRDEPGILEFGALRDAASTLAGLEGAVLVLAGSPNGRDLETLHHAAEEQTGRWTAVVVGRVPQPRWRLLLDADGMVETGFLTDPVARRPDHPLAAPDPDDPEPDSDPDPVPAAAAAGGFGSAGTGRGGERRLTWRAGVAGAGAAAVVAAVVVLLTTGHIGSSGSTPVARGSALPHVTATGPSSAPTTSPPAAPTTAAATTAAPVGNPPPPPGPALRNPATGKCLSAGVGTDGTPLRLAGCNGDANQAWQVMPNGTIQSQGLCMDAAWGATTPGTVVQVARCSGNPAQLFSIRGTTVYSQQANLCVGVANGGAAIHLAACSGATSTFKRP